MNDTLRASRDIIIRTGSLDEAARFYASVLGLRLSSRSKTLLGFETGAFCLYVESGPPHGPVFEFLAADFTATRQRLLDAGCTIVEEDAAVPRCYLRDPFGLTFNLGRAG